MTKAYLSGLALAAFMWALLAGATFSMSEEGFCPSGEEIMLVALYDGKVAIPIPPPRDSADQTHMILIVNPDGTGTMHRRLPFEDGYCWTGNVPFDLMAKMIDAFLYEKEKYEAEKEKSGPKA